MRFEENDLSMWAGCAVCDDVELDMSETKEKDSSLHGSSVG